MEPETKIEADTPIGKFKVSGHDVNTIATLITLVLASLLVVLVWQHMAHASQREDSSAKASQEIVQALREQNCLIAIPEAQREAKADFCKRISK